MTFWKHKDPHCKHETCTNLKNCLIKHLKCAIIVKNESNDIKSENFVQNNMQVLFSFGHFFDFIM